MADEDKAVVQGSVPVEGAIKEKGHDGAQKKAHKKVVRKKASDAPNAASKAHHAPAKKVAEHAPMAEPASPQTIPADKVLAGLLVVALLLAFYFFYQNSILAPNPGPGTTLQPPVGGGQVTSSGGSDKARLEFYVMSQCPYGIQVLDAIAPVLKKMGGSVDFSVDYIGQATGDTFNSLHGQGEVDEDIRELCAIKNYPENYKFMEYIVCRDRDIRGTGWEKCASDNGMDAAKIKSCSEGAEGKELLKASFAKASKAGATGSPTMMINGQAYRGGRKDTDFMTALCGATGGKASACGDIPKPVKVDIKILNDKRCKECDTTQLEASLKTVFPGAVFTKLDYGSAEGKTLFGQSGVQFLPAVLFDDTVKKDPGLSNVEQYLVPAGQYQSLRIGADFDPASEICDNAVDDNGDGKVDCKDPECANKMVCRQDKPETLDLFVMSQCPYGVQALNAMKEVLAAFPDMKFGLHFIGGYDEATGVINSLHGQGEVAEDTRELCAAKYYPLANKYMEYVWCRNKALTNPAWEACATDNGMDAARIKSCSEGAEGKELLRTDMKIADELGVGASPTWLANNRYQFSGIDAATAGANYCKYNPGVPGCEKTLTAAAPSGSGQAAAGCGV
jgi:2-hydroxychromene-2-carboxylate isomerase